MWYEKHKLNSFELMTALHYANNPALPYSECKTLIPFLKSYIPDLKGHHLKPKSKYRNRDENAYFILNCFFKAYADTDVLLRYKIDELEDMIARLPTSFKKNEIPLDGRGYAVGIGWYNLIACIGLGPCLCQFQTEMINNPQALKRYYDLRMYIAACAVNAPELPKSIDVLTATQYQKVNAPLDFISYHAYKNKLITEEDFQFQLLLSDDFMKLLDQTGQNKYKVRAFKNEVLPFHLFKSLKNRIIDIELERGDLPTEVTRYICNISNVSGIDYLFKLLDRLEKENFTRGYYYGDSKKEVFSYLIKHCHPLESETVDDFIEKAGKSNISKKRWIEVACYVPHLVPWIGQLLGMPALESAVWWFHAHASDYMSKEKEAIVARYSSIDKQDFQEGAFDVYWFQEVYTALGKANWKIIHEGSKYISDGHAHRQVKLYSNVMLGELKIRETILKIKEKRDKIYVKALGLIPLSKTNREKDVLQRYNVLQCFLKERKQFGAQRQESEKKAVEIGLDNLSRNAGFEDRIRFSWAMEAKATLEIMKNAIVEIDVFKVELRIDTFGKADLNVQKNGKSLKSLPVKLKKEKAIIALQEGRRYLKNQYTRTRKSLEDAMILEDEFSVHELAIIMEHPIVKVLLGKLVLFNKKTKQSGFWKIDGIYTLENHQLMVEGTDRFVIAHASHLFTSKTLSMYQKHAFTKQLTQPFKQIFRELYVVTKNEIETGTRSQRYQGHQIQPRKTVSLLRSRGWTVDYDEGLQKVYHKKGYVVSMYAMADWYSPSDIEAPTLEYVCFYSEKDYKPIALKDVNSVVFSEVMRDVDLVVSVAHVGGVDPEASYSTMEMRAVLCRESAVLFQLDNVVVKERHILIHGKLGDYTIHLGSGIVSKNGVSLSIIPVHSQHRGRLFLPFIDDDPKSAEIISKMKLLSEDAKIQDPTILAQLCS